MSLVGLVSTLYNEDKCRLWVWYQHYTMKMVQILAQFKKILIAGIQCECGYTFVWIGLY